VASLKILIAGDSFAADWSIKYPEAHGWPNMLANEHEVTNVAEAGCGEYKIFQQLRKQELKDFDVVIVSHTSPYRIHTNFHPIHNQDKLHHNSDFIYEDCRAHGLTAIVEYFEKYYDLDYARYVHTQICRDLHMVVSTQSNESIHITHGDWEGLFNFHKMLNFEELAKIEPGNTNHYSAGGNRLVFNMLKERLASI